MTAKRHVSRFLKEAGRSTLYREPGRYIGAQLSATFEVPLLHADRGDVRLEKVILLVDQDVAAAAGNYWTFDVINKGSAGSGTTSLFATPPTTLAASMGAISKYVAYELVPDQNQEIALGETVSFKATVSAGNPDDLYDLVVIPQYRSDF